MYIYEMIRDDGSTEDTCVTFKYNIFSDFLLSNPAGHINVVRKGPSPATYRLENGDQLINFWRDAPDVDVRVDLGSRIPKLLVVGHAQHGKDTVIERMREYYGVRGCSSSEFATEHIIMPHFEKLGKGYATAKECHSDRVNNRSTWYDLIVAYNGNDLTRIAREILTTHDAYCGMRNRRELWACQNANIFDCVIWVDASDRMPLEGAGSMTIQPWMADITLDNNGWPSQLEHNLAAVMNKLGISRIKQ